MPPRPHSPDPRQTRSQKKAKTASDEAGKGEASTSTTTAGAQTAAKASKAGTGAKKGKGPTKADAKGKGKGKDIQVWAFEGSVRVNFHSFSSTVLAANMQPRNMIIIPAEHDELLSEVIAAFVKISKAPDDNDWVFLLQRESYGRGDDAVNVTEDQLESPLGQCEGLWWDVDSYDKVVINVYVYTSGAYEEIEGMRKRWREGGYQAAMAWPALREDPSGMEFDDL